MTGFSLSRSLVVAALLACFTVSAAAQEEKAKKRKGARGQGGQGFFSADAQKAVSGLNGLVSVSKEQRQGIAKIRKEALADEDYQAALKTSKDKNAERTDRRAAQKTLKEAKAALQAKFVQVLTEEQRGLVAKVNAAADAAASAIRAEYKQKLKDAKGDKAARKALAQEVGEKVAASVKEKVLGLLSDEQKSAVAEAAKNSGKKGGRRKKKDGADGEKKKKKKVESE